jgi:4-amino-4-deoxy-L-arabinose transferase-like glycosyltransferase
MSQKAFIVGKGWIAQTVNSIDWLWGLALLLAALVLYGVNLGELPLRDWDEGLVAQVAREISRSTPDSLTWLFPAIDGSPYLNKPPLMHVLIASAFQFGGVNEWTARLPSALLTAISVPLLYGVGRELFHRRTPAAFAALVYLTWLPVVRQGRLAMLDGAVLCFLLIMIWCVLRSRRNSRYALGIGLGLGLICLTKGVMLGLLMGTIAIAFLAWDTPRLLKLPYLWGGVLLGIVPVALWYVAQWQHYGASFFDSHLVQQSFSRIWRPVENNGGPPWYYLLEILKNGFPWVLFLPIAGKLTWENRNLGWAKLVIVWSGLYFIAVSLMSTKLPWYAMPLYPAFALAIGAQLAALWQRGRHLGIRQADPGYSRLWIVLFAVLAISTWAVSFYFGTQTATGSALTSLLAAMALTLSVSAVLVSRQDPEFLAVLTWGTFVTLLLLMLSPHWIWELAETYPVKPVAALINKHTPTEAKVFTSYPNHRPSLDFYSDRPVQPASLQKLRQLWQRPKQPYLLLDADTLKSLDLDRSQTLGSTEGWTLVTRQPSP